MPIATAAAEPLLDPPGVWARFHGLTVGGGSKLANSVVTVLPRMIAPASRSRATIGASRSARCSFRNGEPASVGHPAMLMMSLIAIGIPCKGPRQRSRRSSSAICWAVVLAPASVSTPNPGVNLRVRTFRSGARHGAARRDQWAKAGPYEADAKVAGLTECVAWRGSAVML